MPFKNFMDYDMLRPGFEPGSSAFLVVKTRKADMLDRTTPPELLSGTYQKDIKYFQWIGTQTLRISTIIVPMIAM